MKVEYLRSDPGVKTNHQTSSAQIMDYAEKTAANTPQQNGVVERKLTVLIQRARTDVGRELDESARDLLWAESINTANDMENISSNTLNKKSPYELFTGKQSKLYGNLVEFGRRTNSVEKEKLRQMEREVVQGHYGGVRKESFCRYYRLYNPVKTVHTENRRRGWIGPG
jgi:hypothetical protein